MGKREPKIKRVEKNTNIKPIQEVKIQDLATIKRERKLKIKNKIKRRMLLKNINSSLTAICKVVNVYPHGYELKILKHPTNEVNSNYQINDLFEYFTFNNTYEIGDIIEFNFEDPNHKSSRLMKKRKGV